MPATPAKKTAPAKRTAAAPPRRARAATIDDLPVTPPAVSGGKYTLGQQRAESTERLFDLTVPSGALCQVRRPGAQGLIAAGLLDSVDQLTSLVQTEHINAKDPKAKAAADAAAAKAIAADPNKVAAGFELVDKLTAYVVIQPALWVDYQTKGEDAKAWEGRQKAAREVGAIAVRDVDLFDKMFIMQWAMGGSADLESFREGFDATLGDMAGL